MAQGPLNPGTLPPYPLCELTSGPDGREDNLPAELRENGNVKKGTVLLFSRDSSGRLKGKANGHPLVEVQSPKLCQVQPSVLGPDAAVPACDKCDHE